MSDEIRVNSRPAPQMQPMQPEVAEGSGKSSKAPWIVLILVIIVLAAVGFMFRDKLMGKVKDAKVSGVTTTAYQAVFLTNGQVYFGKLSETGGDYITLTDIYYLQVVQPPLQGQQQAGATTPAATTAASPQISLVKLGNELHGPVDLMHISRSQVLFFEDLKDDGAVVKAIIADKNTKK